HQHGGGLPQLPDDQAARFAGAVRRDAAQRDVQPVRHQIHRAVTGLDFHRHLRMGAQVGRDDRREKAFRQQRRGAQADRAGRLGLQFGQAFVGGAQAFQGGFAMPVEMFAGFRQHHRAGGAMQQADPQALFQGCHPPAQPGLLDASGPRGGAETTVADRQGKEFQVIQIAHGRSVANSQRTLAFDSDYLQQQAQYNARPRHRGTPWHSQQRYPMFEKRFDEKSATSAILGAWLGFSALACYLLFVENNTNVYAENGILETTQAVLLALACVLFLATALWEKGQGRLVVLFCSLLCYGFVLREVDVETFDIPDLLILLGS